MVLLDFVGGWAADKAVLTTTDFTSGSLSILNLETFRTSKNLINIHSDAVVRVFGKRVYIVNRLGQDNILVVDLDYPEIPVMQFSTGNGSNPQDIAFLSETKAYVARLASAKILVVNPITGDSLKSIDISYVADTDGIPEAAHLTLFDGRLYVTCLRLDQTTFRPSGRGMVAVLDTDTDTVIDQDLKEVGLQGIVLRMKNPYQQVRFGNKLYFSCVGNFSDLTDGGIEVISLEKNSNEGNTIGEIELDGNPGSLALSSENRGYVVVTNALFVNNVKEFDLRTREVFSPLSGTSGGFIPAIAELNGQLFVLDQGNFLNPGTVGMRIYDTSSNTLVVGPISTGLPPNSIAFYEPGKIGIGESNGKVSILDDKRFRSDFSGDGKVGFEDFLLLVEHFGNHLLDPDFDPKVDLDDDGTVGFSDFLLFADDFGKKGVKD